MSATPDYWKIERELPDTRDLSGSRGDILDYISDNPGASRQEIFQELDYGLSTVSDKLKEIKRYGFVEQRAEKVNESSYFLADEFKQVEANETNTKLDRLLEE